MPLAEAHPALIRVPVLNGKRLELLKETIPGIARVAEAKIYHELLAEPGRSCEAALVALER